MYSFLDSCALTGYHAGIAARRTNNTFLASRMVGLENSCVISVLAFEGDGFLNIENSTVDVGTR